MRTRTKILSGLIVLAIGLSIPAIDGWMFEPHVQALNAIPLAIIEIILVCVGPSAFFGAATAYLLLTAIVYTDESTHQYHSSFILIGLFVVHLIFGLPAVFIGAISGHLIGRKIRRKHQADPTRGFEVVMPNTITDQTKNTG